MRLTLALIAVLLSAAPAAKAQVGALQTDCGLGGKGNEGVYQFVATCAGRSISPDGQFAIVQRAYQDKQPKIEFQDARGRRLGKLATLSDDMPISVSWAPNSRWFYVNHHVGSFMDELQIFEIVGRSAIERPAVAKSAVQIAIHRYPCLTAPVVHPTGARWTADSRKIVIVTVSATYACDADFSKRPGAWHSLWMIGDVQTGDVDADTIRVQPDDKPFETPRDRAYSR